MRSPVYRTLCILLFLAGCAFACGDAYRTPPIPIEEARTIIEMVQFAVNEEVEAASKGGANFSNTNWAGTCITTGNSSQDTYRKITTATLVMSDFKIGESIYYTAGTLSYKHTDYLASEADIWEYDGKFTLAKGVEESWEFRWKLKQEAYYPTESDILSYRMSGSYSIDGVPYSYPKEHQ